MAGHESLPSSEAAIEKRFECRDRQAFANDFKSVKFSLEGLNIVSSQLAHLDTKEIAHGKDPADAKFDLICELADEKSSKHREAADTRAWIGTRAFLSSECLASKNL